MLVRDVMTRHAETVAPEFTLQEAALKMRSLNVGSLPVLDGERPVGMVTDRDIVVRGAALGKDPVHTQVREVMTHQAVYCYDDQDTLEAARIMEAMALRRLMVLDRSDALVGMLTVDDLATVARQERLAGEVIDASVTPRPVSA
jgi:CBS domain-containing protein